MSKSLFSRLVSCSMGFWLRIVVYFPEMSGVWGLFPEMCGVCGLICNNMSRCWLG